MSRKKPFFSKETKFSELMTDDRRLLQLLPRFGIGLGFGDRNVEQTCQMNQVNAELFLMICEIYSDERFKPGQEELKNITRKTGIKSVSGLTVYALLKDLITEDDLI